MAYVDDSKQDILNIIDSWSGKLSWDLLATELQRQLKLKKKPSRHTLILHDDITHAYDLRKGALRDKKSDMMQQAKAFNDNDDALSDLLKNIKDEDATIAALAERAKKLEMENEQLHAKNKRLEKTNDILLEQFQRWQYNLNKMNNVDMNQVVRQINESLPEKKRQ
jgi:septal ring factor EnvC (AmiA/AmiB activator)